MVSRGNIVGVNAPIDGDIAIEYDDDDDIGVWLGE
jgi:hypothetical protein